MASQLKIDSARANGAKSHGPITPEGLQKSSLNALKHGAFAKTMVLANESAEILEKMHQAYVDKFQPTDLIERDLVYEMVAAKWRQFRVWAVETASLDLEVDRQKEKVDKGYQQIDQTTRLALAFEALSGDSKSLSTFARCETRYGLQFNRALKTLLDLRQSKVVSGKPPTSPPPIELRNEPKLDPAPEPQGPAPVIAPAGLRNEPKSYTTIEPVVCLMHPLVGLAPPPTSLPAAKPDTSPLQ